jgi:carbon-monoxide dehydrogenase medium subunit
VRRLRGERGGGVKPAAFTYYRPETVTEAVATLADLGGDGKVLAGGQSLVPMLNMRIAMPAALVDVNRVRGLDGIEVGDAVRIGATARQYEVEASSEVRAAQPLLGQALAYVGHRAIRSRGTIVGSLAHADPAAELPAVLVLLGGSVTAVGPSGEREIAAADLFAGFFQTTIAPDELLTAATFPSIARGEGTAVVESARRQGDFALCGVAANVRADGGGRVAVFGVERVSRVFDVDGDEASLDRLGDELEPLSDIHASADFRRHLATVLAKRAVAAARTNARGGGNG